MKKNDVLTIRIEDMGVDGEGIGKVDNIPLFVKDALIGDVVSVKRIMAMPVCLRFWNHQRTV